MLIIAKNIKIENKNFKIEQIADHDVCYDSSFTRRDFNDAVVIYKGESFDMEHRKIDIQTCASLKNLILSLKSSYGFFVCIVIKKNQLNIYKSIVRNIDVFFAKQEDGYVISDSVHTISSLTGKNNLSTESLRAFLTESWNAQFLSPLMDTHKIFGGCKTVFHNKDVFSVPFIDLTKYDCDFVQEIAGMVKEMGRGKQIFLHLSGGFDSTFIFYILVKHNIDFKVITHSPLDSDGDSEVLRVKKLCLQHNVTCIVKSAFPAKFVDKATVNHPFDENILPVIDGDADYQELLDNDNVLFINGHGGDSLFVQNPSTKCVSYLMRRCRLISGISAIFSLNRLKYIPLSRILFKGNDKSTSGIVYHPLLVGYNTNSPNFDHLSDLVYLMESASVQNGSGALIFSPFLTPIAYRIFLNYRYEKHFNGSLDRLIARKMAYNLSKDDGVFDIRKKSSLNVLYKIITDNEELLTTILNSGDFSFLLNDFSKEVLNESLDFNVSHGPDDNSFIFVNILKLSRFLNSNKLEVGQV